MILTLSLGPQDKPLFHISVEMADDADIEVAAGHLGRSMRHVTAMGHAQGPKGSLASVRLQELRDHAADLLRLHQKECQGLVTNLEWDTAIARLTDDLRSLGVYFPEAPNEP